MCGQRIARVEADAAVRRAARTAGADGAVVEIQGVPGETAIAGRDLFLLVVVYADQHVAALAGHAPGEVRRLAGAVTRIRHAVVVADFEAVEVLARDEVHDAADGVGTVDRARTFLQHFDALDQVDRHDVDVDGTLLRDGTDATIIEEDQGALGVEAAQFNRRGAVAAAVVYGRVRRRARDGGHLLNEFTHRRHAGRFDGAAVHREDRARGFGIHAADARTGDHDLLEFRVLRNRFWRVHGSGGCGRRHKREMNGVCQLRVGNH